MKSNSFPVTLKSERKLRGWSQRQLAEKLECYIQTIRRWERGNGIPAPYFRQRLCELFGKSAEELGLLSEQTDEELGLLSEQTDKEFSSLPFSERLRRLRGLRGWSQRQLAEELGCNFHMLGRWEAGSAIPKSYFRQRLCELFGLDSVKLGLLSKQTDEEFYSLPFGRRLQRLRELRGWSQAELADMLKTEARMVRRWESEGVLPSLFYQQRLCELFGMDSEELGLLSEVEELVDIADPSTFGDKVPNRILSRARRSRGWRQCDVAEKVETCTMNVSRWERGEAIPGVEFRRRLCELFEKSTEELGFDNLSPTQIAQVK